MDVSGIYKNLKKGLSATLIDDNTVALFGDVCSLSNLRSYARSDYMGVIVDGKSVELCELKDKSGSASFASDFSIPWS